MVADRDCTQCRPSDTRPTRMWSRRDTEGGLLSMRRLFRPLAFAAGLFTVAALAAACGSAGSSGTAAPSKASGAGCAGVADTTLVVLQDDKHLQQADVVIPAINKAVANPQMLAALDGVSTTM